MSSSTITIPVTARPSPSRIPGHDRGQRAGHEDPRQICRSEAPNERAISISEVDLADAGAGVHDDHDDREDVTRMTRDARPNPTDIISSGMIAAIGVTSRMLR